MNIYACYCCCYLGRQVVKTSCYNNNHGNIFACQLHVFILGLFFWLLVTSALLLSQDRTCMKSDDLEMTLLIRVCLVFIFELP